VSDDAGRPCGHDMSCPYNCKNTTVAAFIDFAMDHSRIFEKYGAGLEHDGLV